MAAAAKRQGRRRSRGQVIIEMLIILPLFLMLTFVIMETGHLAFQTLILHHAAFELARIGSLSAAPRPGEGYSPQIGRAKYMMEGVLKRIFPKGNAGLSPAPRVEDTLPDPQSGLPNHDLVVTIEYRCPLIFPFTNLALQNEEGPIKKTIGGGRYRVLYAEVRMPIQQPTFN